MLPSAGATVKHQGPPGRNLGTTRYRKEVFQPTQNRVIGLREGPQRQVSLIVSIEQWWGPSTSARSGSLFNDYLYHQLAQERRSRAELIFQKSLNSYTFQSKKKGRNSPTQVKTPVLNPLCPFFPKASFHLLPCGRRDTKILYL